VKLLLDENLSHQLVRRIEDLFPESLHVRSVGLKQTPDKTVWEYARSRGFSIVTANADFYDLAIALGPPPRVIWLRGCDYPTDEAENLIRGQAIRIAEFLGDSERAVLILRRQRSFNIGTVRLAPTIVPRGWA
jgi:predicted nuclease of predicted toxin-antitoxin system